VKGAVAILVCDGKPDSSGEVFRKDGVQLPDTEVPVVLEFQNDLAAHIGKAKLYWRENVLFADLDLLDTRMKENASKILYPAVDGVVHERRGDVLYKTEVKRVGLSIGCNADSRIGTLHSQGVR
jgi:hypothetical protein